MTCLSLFDAFVKTFLIQKYAISYIIFRALSISFFVRISVHIVWKGILLTETLWVGTLQRHLPSGSCPAGFSAWAGLLPQQLPFRRRAILPGRAFFAAGDSNGFSCCIKKTGTAVSCDVSYFPSLRQYLFFTIVSGSLLMASGYCKFL